MNFMAAPHVATAMENWARRAYRGAVGAGLGLADVGDDPDGWAPGGAKLRLVLCSWIIVMPRTLTSVTCF
jgi:hypothetical protein